MPHGFLSATAFHARNFRTVVVVVVVVVSVDFLSVISIHVVRNVFIRSFIHVLQRMSAFSPEFSYRSDCNCHTFWNLKRFPIYVCFSLFLAPSSFSEFYAGSLSAVMIYLDQLFPEWPKSFSVSCCSLSVFHVWGLSYWFPSPRVALICGWQRSFL